MGSIHSIVSTNAFTVDAVVGNVVHRSQTLRYYEWGVFPTAFLPRCRWHKKLRAEVI